MVDSRAMDRGIGTARLFYNLATAPVQAAGFFAPLFARALTREQKRFWLGRLAVGLPRLPEAKPGPRVWLHGASLGEMQVADSILSHLAERLGSAEFVLTSGTPHGLTEAQKRTAGRALCLPYPLDLLGPVKRFVNIVRPDVYVPLETEIWPNLLSFLMLRSTPVVLANARLSARSFGRYRAMNRFFRPIVRGFAKILAISEADRDRFLMLGVKKERVEVMGNAKYDQLPARARAEAARRASGRLGFGPGSKVVVAGSIRSQEVEFIPRAFAALSAKHPEARLVAAPRHLKRVPDLVEELKKHGISHRLLSEEAGGAEPLAVVVDELGVLFDLYSAAHAAFVGGSLVNLGGQNPLEPAAWAVPVLFGPHMDNFALEADSLIAARGGEEVRDADSLARELSRLLTDPESRNSMGKNAKSALMDVVGSGKRQAMIIARIAAGARK